MNRARVMMLTIVVVLAALLVAKQALAQSNCADRTRLVQSLQNSYGEAFTGGGLQSAEQIIEVWVSEEKGTWTILMTRADGRSCILASGTNWRDGEAVAKGVPG